MTKRILYIEDDFLIRLANEELAQDLPDIQVISAADGQQAADILSSSHIDLIVSDTNFPENRTFFSLVRDQYHQTPLALLTGATPEVIAEIVGIDRVEVFKKPKDWLPAVIDHLLQKLSPSLPEKRRRPSLSDSARP